MVVVHGNHSVEIGKKRKFRALAHRSKSRAYRILDDGFGVIVIAAAVPKEHSGRYISEFVEDAKSSGIVQQAINRAGLRGIEVLPPRKSQSP
jgi:hypothetical protein